MAWDLKQCILDITVYSDASGGWGCGAFADELWFQLEWPLQVKDFSIAIKELIPVVVSAALFGKAWSGRLVEFNPLSRISHLTTISRNGPDRTGPNPYTILRNGPDH